MDMPLEKHKESGMAESGCAVKPDEPILEVHSTKRATVSNTLGGLSRSSSFVPTSPKTHELRARHETLRISDKDLKPFNSDRGV